jgi:hypothetical protein
MLPKWLLPAAVAVLAAAVVLAVLWFTLVKPTVQTAAREAGKAAAEEAQAELQEQANLAERRAVAAEEKANAAEKKVDEMAANGGPGDGAAGGGARGATTDDQGVDISNGTAVDFRITTDADAQADPAEFESFAVPNGAIPPDKTLVLTDIILQNPRGDSGTLAIKRGDDVLYATGLQNFRDMDFHFLEPWTFSPDQPLTVEVSCQLPGAPEPATGKCTPAVSFSGRLSGPTPN